MLYHEIGPLLRKHRKAKKLKLLDIRKTSGVSAAMLSKIENGRMIPTIPTLFAIMSSMHISPEDFFSELGTQTSFPGYIFVAKNEHTPFVKETSADGFLYFSILEHQVQGTSLQVALLHLAPGAKRRKVTTQAFEYIYVLEGNLSYHLDDKQFDMTVGDSLLFDGKIPHVPINVSENTNAILLVTYLFY